MQLKIRQKLLLLTTGVVIACLVAFSTLTIWRYQGLLLQSTFEACQNLSLNISRVSREELVLGELYEDTRGAIAGLNDRAEENEIVGLLNSYVIADDGTIVAHTDAERIGQRIPDAALETFSSFQSLTRVETRLDGNEIFRFVAPIFVEYQGQTLWIGATVFEFDRDEIYAPVLQTQNEILLLSGGILLLSILVAYWLSNRLSRPVEALTNAAIELKGGHLGKQVPVTTGDEIGKLSEIFNDMSVTLRDSEARRAEQAAMNREFAIAQDIQLSLLPAESAESPYRFRGYMRTADLVGGDYFDCIRVRSKKQSYWWFIIGDVSGHGLSAGLVMLMAQTSIHTALQIRPDLNTDAAFAEVNRILHANINRLRETRYMTASFYRADERGNFVNSGLHLDTILYRNRKRKIELMPTDGMWLGIESKIDHVLKRTRFQLKKHDLVFLHTDGITESRDTNGEMFGEERLMKIIEAYGHEPVEDLEARVLDALMEFTGDAPPDDDISFAMIKKV